MVIWGISMGLFAQGGLPILAAAGLSPTSVGVLVGALGLFVVTCVNRRPPNSTGT